MGFKSHICIKKKNQVSSGFARVWSGYCLIRSFIKPGPVLPPGRPAGPDRAGFINNDVHSLLEIEN